MPDQPPRSTHDDALGWALHRLSAAWAAEDADMARQMGLSAGDYTALKHVAANDGIGPAALARQLGMSTGSVNALINRLSDAGHLQRRRDPTDARRLLLHLSGTTGDAIVGHYRDRSRAVTALGPDLTPEEQRIIIEFLDRAVSAATDR